MNAGIHGNWTIDNSKSKLHQFMQMHKIQTDYKYTPIGPDHTKYDTLLLYSFVLVDLILSSIGV